MSLPPFVDRAFVQARLLELLVEGTPNHKYCTREMAASTVVVALYINAIEGTGVWLAPRHVCWMSDEQLASTSDAARIDYCTKATTMKGFKPIGTTWYRDNTREPIRDETLRQGLMQIGAVTFDPTVPTNSDEPRYALKADFAAIFDPALTGDALENAIHHWRGAHLTPSSLNRIKLIQEGMSDDPNGILVTFPNKDTQKLSPGTSSVIAKAVIEVFAARYLEKPAVLWLSEGAKKVVKKQDDIAKKIGLSFDQQKLLPDIILIDLHEPEILLVFVEVVHTDGPVTEGRRQEMMALAAKAGFTEANTAFVTAFLDREAPALRKALGNLAWNSFIFIASEPEGLIMLHKASKTALLHSMLASPALGKA